MIVEDFVCLGRTVPEQSKKYGHRVCCAGYSRELNQLIRVYPLMVRNPVKCRGVYRMHLERNPSDGRRESWKLKPGSTIEQVATNGFCLDDLHDFIVPSVQFANENRMSLAVVDVNASGEFAERAGVSNAEQLELFDDLRDAGFGASAVDIAPYLVFADDGGMHRLQVREWGCYEFIRKRRQDAAKLGGNLALHRRQLLVIGNMNHRRNVWLVIKTFALPEKPVQPELFA